VCFYRSAFLCALSSGLSPQQIRADKYPFEIVFFKFVTDFAFPMTNRVSLRTKVRGPVRLSW